MRARQGEIAAAVGATAIIAGILAGCGQPVVPPLPSPTATAAFASDEEALAAAEAAYVRYQAAVDHALSTADASQLAEVAVGEALEKAEQSAQAFAASGARQVGLSVVVSLGPADLAGLTGVSGEASAQVYACLSLASVEIHEPDGTVSQSDVEQLPMLVDLQLVESKLFVSREEVWDGSNFCA